MYHLILVNKSTTLSTMENTRQAVVKQNGTGKCRLNASDGKDGSQRACFP